MRRAGCRTPARHGLAQTSAAAACARARRRRETAPKRQAETVCAAAPSRARRAASRRPAVARPEPAARPGTERSARRDHKRRWRRRRPRARARDRAPRALSSAASAVAASTTSRWRVSATPELGAQRAIALEQVRRHRRQRAQVVLPERLRRQRDRAGARGDERGRRPQRPRQRTDGSPEPREHGRLAVVARAPAS